MSGECPCSPSSCSKKTIAGNGFSFSSGAGAGETIQEVRGGETESCRSDVVVQSVCRHYYLFFIRILKLLQREKDRKSHIFKS